MPSKNMLPKGQRRHSVRAEYRKLRTELEEQKAAREAGQLPAEAADEEPENDFYDVAEMMAVELPDPSNPYLRIANTAGTRNDPQTVEERRYPGLQMRDKAPEIAVLDDLEAEDGVRSFTADAAAKGMRLDAYLAKALPDISRGRVQMLIENGQVLVNGTQAKASARLKGGEPIEIEGEPRPEPLHAEPEDIPLDVIYEDGDLAVINKPAAMTVHAGAGSAEQNRGTLVNALLFHFGSAALADTGDPVRPGIVHRLDRDTSGLIVVAKNDSTHRRLAEMFSSRSLRKVYLALVHGQVAREEGTIELPVARDLNRRIRMTTRRADGRPAVSHFRVLERLDTPYGRFTLLEVRIETGRTHQIRVHLQALGHPVVGDTLYGAPAALKPVAGAHVPTAAGAPPLALDRNFLHAAELDFAHPRTGEELHLRAPLPQELEDFLARLGAGSEPAGKRR